MILYEDKDIIVCHKMTGIAVQSARIGEKDLVSMLNNHLMEQADQRMEPVRVVHRLDQPVEGIVVFAKNKKAAASLSAQITDGSMKKVYQAVCCVTEAGGHWIENAGGNDQEHDRLYVEGCEDELLSGCEKGTEGCKGGAAFVSGYGREPTTVRPRRGIHLATGRHHQIRVQMAHAGLPLFGDRKYNPDWELYAKAWQAQMVNESADHAAHRLPAAELALCATELTFRHPKTGKPMHFQVRPQKSVFQTF